MKYMHKFLACAVALALIVAMIPFKAKAETPTAKEEVIYINLNTDGSVKDITVVNIFDLDADGKILDYGRYESIRNMTTTDELGYANETITVDAKAGRLYYEGKLRSEVMPWNISIRYFLDGVEYAGKDIAGKSGDLKISIQITKNEACVGNFFEGMALQTSLSLDTGSCTDIRADGATIANVGSKKQLTFTILPGKGADLQISAKVKDFRMDGVAINGVKLKLNIQIDDDAIQNKITQILDAIRQVDDGAGQLQDGVSQVQQGSGQIYDKVGEMADGVGQLQGGSQQLANGLAQIAQKNEELMGGAWQVYEGLCSAAEMVINAKLAEYALDPIVLTPDNYEEVLASLLEQIDEEKVYQMAYDQALAMVTLEVEARQDEVYMGYIESIADSVYMTYLRSQAEELYEMVVRQIVKEQLMGAGMSEEAAEAMLQTERGQQLVRLALMNLTDEQKEQIIQGAFESLTEEQKQQIRQGAVESLTEEQKQQIREGYIDQVMKSEEVTSQIQAAVDASGSAAGSIVSLKSQLDNYSVFYSGLKTYTDAVADAAAGAQTLDMNMQTLQTAVGTLHTALGTLHDGTNQLLEGSTELKEGTGEFLDQISGSEDEISGMIDAIVESFSGSDVQLGSFVSDKNTNVKSVQFVIKTEAIDTEPLPEPLPVTEEKLTFWQKLWRLFGFGK